MLQNACDQAVTSLELSLMHMKLCEYILNICGSRNISEEYPHCILIFCDLLDTPTTKQNTSSSSSGKFRFISHCDINSK